MKAAKALPILMYHHVSPSPGLVTVSPEIFSEHMEYLARAGYTTLRADEFVDFLQGRRSVPAKSVLITFDDGYLDNYVHAYPVLQRLGLHAVIFTVTGWIGDGPPRPHAGQPGAELPHCPSHRDCKLAIQEGRADSVMVRWSEIEAMERSGAIEVHSHTHSHVRWDKTYAAAERLAQLEQDLIASRDVLRSRLGRASPHLCWPWGHREAGYRETAEKVGYMVQYTVDNGINTPGTDPREIRRLAVKERGARWLASRLFIYRHPTLARLYLGVRKTGNAG
jgi:peptidoglycan/xylan/chitin deacetylase (PgdA/CDA1 family)